MFDGPGGSDRAELFAMIGKFESRDTGHVIQKCLNKNILSDRRSRK